MKYLKSFSWLVLGGVTAVSAGARGQAPKEVLVVNPVEAVIAGPVEMERKVSPYQKQATCENVSVPDAIFCYFDVPAGKILQIEKVSGQLTLGAPKQMQLNGEGGLTLTQFVPRVETRASFYFFEADGPAYVTDDDGLTDASGNPRDFMIPIVTDGAGNAVGSSTVWVIGRLYDDS